MSSCSSNSSMLSDKSLWSVHIQFLCRELSVSSVTFFFCIICHTLFSRFKSSRSTSSYFLQHTRSWCSCIIGVCQRNLNTSSPFVARASANLIYSSFVIRFSRSIATATVVRFFIYKCAISKTLYTTHTIIASKVDTFL